MAVSDNDTRLYNRRDPRLHGSTDHDDTVPSLVGGLVPTDQLATGTPDGTLFLRDDQTWAAPPGGGGGGAPTNATYITQTANASLSNEQALASLATGIVKNTTTTGVLSIAAAGTDYQAPIGTISGIAKGNGANALTAAVAGTDYQSPIGTISGIAKGNGANALTAATAGTDYYAPGGTDIAVADGGTGASTAQDARTNLLPSKTGNTLKVLRVNAGETDYELATITSASGDVVGDDVSTTAQNIVAYTGTGGKNITELTGTQGDVLYHNGTSWQKLGAGTAGYFLQTRGAGADPRWWPHALYNQSVADQGAGFSTDTYLTGSNILIPASALKIGTRYELTFRMTKTAAGTATPKLDIRFGTNGSTADTSRGTLTWTVGTAAADDSVWRVYATFLTVGSGTSATLRTVGQITHKLSVTGTTGAAAVSESEVATSAGFDSTVSNSYIGVSVNGGTSASWTVQLVQAKLHNFA